MTSLISGNKYREINIICFQTKGNISSYIRKIKKRVSFEGHKAVVWDSGSKNLLAAAPGKLAEDQSRQCESVSSNGDINLLH